MFVIILANYAYNSATVDAYRKNADRIYVLGSEDNLGSAYKIQGRLTSRYPEIENTTAFLNEIDNFTYGDNKYAASVSAVDSSFLEIFSIKLLKGDAKTALASKNNILLSKSFAAKMFGKENPIGRVFHFEYCPQDSYVVSGVFEDFSNTILPKTDIIADFTLANKGNNSLMEDGLNNAGMALIFILTKKGTDFQAKTADMLEYFKTFFWVYQPDGFDKEVKLIPLREVYFSPITDGNNLNRGQKKTYRLMLMLALIILAFAVTNYVTLSVAQAGFRSKEMATRQLVGASRGSIFRRMVMEAVIMTAISFIIGFLLAISAEPVAGRLLHTDVNIVGDLDIEHILTYLLLIALTGILAGVIPAAVISRSKPIEIVRGTLRRKTNMVYGKILIAVQNVISVALIAVAIVMTMQTRHMVNAPLGYNTKDILDVDLWGMKYSDQRALKSAFDQLSCVEKSGFAKGVPTTGGNNNTDEVGDRRVSFQILKGDDDYFKILGIKLKDGTDIPISINRTYFNEEAFKECSTPDTAAVILIGKTGAEKYPWPSAGVVRNIKVFNGTREDVPLAVNNLGSFDDLNRDSIRSTPWGMIVKVVGDRKEAKERINAVYKSQTGIDLPQLNYLDEEVEEQFKKEKETATIVSIFAVIAMLISALGLLAISTYYIRQRRKDIAVRKVIGATSSEEIGRIVGSYMILVAVAFLIACPVAWYYMDKWLRNYTYRISLSPLIFIAAGLACALIAFIAIFFQTRAAANENPINSLNRQ